MTRKFYDTIKYEEVGLVVVYVAYLQSPRRGLKVVPPTTMGKAKQIPRLLIVANLSLVLSKSNLFLIKTFHWLTSEIKLFSCWHCF